MANPGPSPSTLADPRSPEGADTGIHATLATSAAVAVAVAAPPSNPCPAQGSMHNGFTSEWYLVDWNTTSNGTASWSPVISYRGAGFWKTGTGVWIDEHHVLSEFVEAGRMT